jgi:hypothetical protein
MTIDSDTNGSGGVSQGSVSRSYVVAIPAHATTVTNTKGEREIKFDKLSGSSKSLLDFSSESFFSSARLNKPQWSDLR